MLESKKKLIEIIKRLYYDRAFGILTRGGIEEEILKLSDSFDFVFIDFNNVSKLNLKNGYKKVNDTFSAMFETFAFRSDDLVGRWFSGDEIVIITKNDPYGLLERFKIHALTYGITFKSIIFKDVQNLESVCSLIDTIRFCRNEKGRKYL